MPGLGGNKTLFRPLQGGCAPQTLCMDHPRSPNAILPDNEEATNPLRSMTGAGYDVPRRKSNGGMAFYGETHG
jgi:hypothetical protein